MDPDPIDASYTTNEYGYPGDILIRPKKVFQEFGTPDSGAVHTPENATMVDTMSLAAQAKGNPTTKADMANGGEI